MWRRLRNAHVLLHVLANGDSPVSLAMTHMQWAHGQSGHESTDDTLSVVPLVGGWEAWPIDRCSNKDVGRRERETLTPCVRTKQAPTKNTTKTTRDRLSQSHIVLCNTKRLGERQTKNMRKQRTRSFQNTEQNMTNTAIQPDSKRTETRQGHATRTSTNNAHVGVRLHFALEYATFLTVVSCQHPWPCDWSRWGGCW